MIGRRTFLGGVGLGIALMPIAATAQQAGKVARIGLLVTGDLEAPETRSAVGALRDGLREHGYTEGRNIVIEYRSAAGNFERFPALAADLARLPLALIVAPNTPAGVAAQRATRTIPIVVPAMGDPVGDGLVTTLARPGGNVTGLTFLGPELVGKRVELLKEALPGASRVAALWHDGAFGKQVTHDMVSEAEAAARTLGVQLQLVGIDSADQLEAAFSTIAKARPDALLLFPSPMLYYERRRIVEFATRYRLPSMSAAREFAQLGSLMAYGASINDLIRRAGGYVAAILEGARPADLPVQQPTKFELVVNLKTAGALGLTMPPSLLLRADEVIR